MSLCRGSIQIQISYLIDEMLQISYYTSINVLIINIINENVYKCKHLKPIYTFDSLNVFRLLSPNFFH